MQKKMWGLSGFIVVAMAFLVGALSCAPKSSTTSSSSSNRYLYVATGACYSGNGITTFTNTTSSNLVFRINLTTGAREDLIADYSASPSNVGDSPVSIADYDSDHILVLVENTTTVSLRRIELIEKASAGTRSIYSNNTTALSAQLRRMRKLSDNYLLVSKSSAAEKMKDGVNRLTIGANPWVSLAAPASSCTTSSTLVTAVTQLLNGMLVFAHASAGQARFGVVSSLGYTAATDCKAAQSSPNANAFPTAMHYDSTNTQMLVSYGGSATTTDLNSIYAYSMSESTGAISSPQKIYDSSLFGSTYNYLLFGIPAMVLDPVTNTLYVATAINTATTAVNYQIDSFTYNPSQIGTSNTSVLSSPNVFYNYGSDTKCISDMIIAD